MPSYRESIVVRIASEPPALFWGGIGPLPLEADAVIPADAVALGAGELVSFPDFQQLINGTAERLEFTVSGVSPETLRLAVEDAPSVSGARVDVGRITFDADWQIDGPVEWEAVFEARSLKVARGRSDGDEVSRAVVLTIVAGDTTRSRANNAYFTDADQRRRSPDDNAAANTGTYSAGTTRRFGPK